MKKIILSSLLGLFAVNPAFAEDKSPIVLELFTSQSCSSCPSADKVLGELTKQDNVIALSCNVTYWNHLSWKDTLSKEFCTDRQRQYVQALRSRGPYTPQIVVNGRHELVGSQGAKIENIIQKEQGAVKSVGLKKKNSDLEITLPKVETGRYFLSLLSYGEDHTQAIPSGENRGKTVSYTNPVQKIESLGSWNGDAKMLTYDISKYGNVRGVVILAQNTNNVGEVIAAGKIEN